VKNEWSGTETPDSEEIAELYDIAEACAAASPATCLNLTEKKSENNMKSSLKNAENFTVINL
jgi:hypothetical protein